jgi:hypothetical protein
VVVFDTPDGGRVSTTLAMLQSWMENKLSQDNGTVLFSHNCATTVQPRISLLLAEEFNSGMCCCVA